MTDLRFQLVVVVLLGACVEPPMQLPQVADSTNPGDSTIGGPDVDERDAGEAVSTPDGANPPTDAVNDGSEDDADMRPDGPNFVGVTTASWSSCAWTEAGRVLCWGSNTSSQVTTDDVDWSPPRWFPPPQDWEADKWRFARLDAAAGRVCGVTTGGAFVCWGQEHDGTIRPRPEAFDLTPFTTDALTDVSIGWEVDCATTLNGVWCWGRNKYGQVDHNEPNVGVLEPNFVTTSTRFAAGPAHSCYVSGTRHAICWGSNSSGRVTPAPGVSSAIVDPKSIAGDFIAVEPCLLHTCAASRNGRVHCWGSPGSYRLGVDDLVLAEDMPFEVPGVVDIVALDGGTVTCGQTAGGTAWCWGGDFEAPTEYRAPDGSEFTSVSVGAAVGCATSPTGLWCWGDNTAGAAGQFVDGMPSPEVVAEPTRVVPPPI